MKNSVTSFLKASGSKISLTIDGWTSIGMKGYYGITAHFVDKNWKIQSIVLDFVPAKGSHTGASVAKILFEVLKSYDMLDCIQGVTTDNAAVNFTMMRSLETLVPGFDYKNKHFVCFAHILNLAVQDFIKVIEPNRNSLDIEKDFDYLEDEIEVENDINNTALDFNSPVSKIKYLVKKIKNSEQMQLKLNSACEAINCKMTMPKLDVPTRWHSTFEMLTWGLSVKNALTIFCDNIENLNNCKILDEEWVLISKFCQYLRSFKTLSSILEGEKYCTLPLVVIGINLLLDKLEIWAHELDKKIDRDAIDEQLIYCIQAARDKILKHYNKTNWIYCIVLILDPRHKVEAFSSSSWGKLLQSEAVQKFEEIFKANYFDKSQNDLQNSIPEPALSPTKEENEFDLDITYLFKKADNDNLQSWKYEIEKYLNEPRSEDSENILDWWRRHENVYPSLSKMAKDFLGTPATSVPAERLFSRAALTITKPRNRLGVDSIRSVLCLNSWLINSDLKMF